MFQNTVSVFACYLFFAYRSYFKSAFFHSTRFHVLCHNISFINVVYVHSRICATPFECHLCKFAMFHNVVWVVDECMFICVVKLQLYIYTYIHVGFPCFTIVVNSCVLYVLGFISLYLFIYFVFVNQMQTKNRKEVSCCWL